MLGDQAAVLLIGVLVGCAASAVCMAVLLWVRTPRDGTAEKAKSASSRRGQEDPFVYGSKTERRTSLRRKGTQVEVGLRDFESAADLGIGWVVDRSLGGLCVAVKAPLEVGQVIGVRPTKAQNSVPWVEVEIKSCRLRDGRWELGCQFLRQPTWNILMLFG